MRAADLARIHILKAQKALPDQLYRRLLQGHFGCASAAALDEAQRLRFIRILEGVPRYVSPTARRIWAEWYALKAKLAPEKRTPQYLAAIIRRAAPDFTADGEYIDLSALDDGTMAKVLRALMNANRNTR